MTVGTDVDADSVLGRIRVRSRATQRPLAVDDRPGDRTVTGDQSEGLED